MSKILFIFAIATLLCGYGFAVALDRRRRKLFDDTCTWYLVMSIASFLASITLCIIVLAIHIFNLG